MLLKNSVAIKRLKKPFIKSIRKCSRLFIGSHQSVENFLKITKEHLSMLFWKKESDKIEFL